jgi:hypothetical protein
MSGIRVLRTIVSIMIVVVIIVGIWQAIRVYHIVFPAHGISAPTIANALAPLQDSGSDTTNASLLQYWQIGITSGDDGLHSTKMQTTIRTRLPQYIADRTTDYYWVGSYLSDRSFIQVGYAVPWYDRVAHWFYCAFTSVGEKGPCMLGPSGSGGKPGSWHRYSLTAVSNIHQGGWNWIATMDGTQIGQLTESTGQTGQFAPVVIAEQSAFEPHEPTNDIGPVEFSPTLEIATQTDALHPVHHAWMLRTSANACPPYGIGVAGNNDILLGNILPCMSPATQLW